MKQAMISHVINRWDLTQGLEQVEDPMIIEKTIDVFVNGEFWREIDCSPICIEDLIIGALALDKVIRVYEDIKELIIDEDQVLVTLDPQANQIAKLSVGQKSNIVGETPGPIIKAEQITKLMNDHIKYSKIHQMTGGVHSMSLSEGETILVCSEDISRNNAVDKIIGYCLKNKIDCSDKIFLSSSRISRLILNKIVFLGAKILVTRATVTDVARAMAIEAGITLIGFARNGRFNIYSNLERIDTSK